MIDKPKILYVDDEEINQVLLKINLSKTYDVITASNGPEGLEILNNIPEIKLVASDMKMPIMNGIEFIKKAKKIHTQLPFFLITGFDITPQIIEAMNSQLIIKHFKKPFNIIEIQAVFLKVISKS